MKIIKIIAISLLLFSCENKKDSSTDKDNFSAHQKDLIVVEQNYKKALEIAKKENKVLFIDFYTSWCAPCEKLDKLVFQNDSIKQILKNDIVLLRYDAENDTVFHLSKKHHVSSYPTGLTLNKNGYVLNRKYGFPGANFETLSKNVIEFINESVALNTKDEFLKGYSNEIYISMYPKFYVDYVNRINTKISNSELSDYLVNTQDKFSEAYFSTLIYFGREAPVSIADMVLDNRQKYIDLYGNTDTEILLYFLTSAKFNVAISEISEEKYDKAVEFTKIALSEKWANDILLGYQKEYLKAQNKWDEVFEINRKLKEKGEFDNGYINHFSWQVFEDCDDQKVIKKCLQWMKEVTNEEPTYTYLDTYANLMYKSGNKTETKRIAQLAIETAKNEKRKSKSMEELINKL